jgi:exodeoxyribonuclease VII large subunit
MSESQKRYLTVTALTKYIKRKFDYDPHLQDVWVRGEISNFKSHSRGHMYFTIKDEHARIQAVMFSSQNRSITFTPENGMKVLLRGEVTVYETSGGYQMYVKEMQPDGIGNLYLAYEELKKKLEEEGLFLEKNKKTLPSYPQTIGVITSPTGAAIRDILTTIKRRYPVVNVIILPALVQGNSAGESIARQIATANKMGNIDVLIVGRGGGSIEELWAFNEELVARTIFDSDIPIISAVGHETDFTIADFVADLRAPTPTAAAELAVPHIAEMAERISVRQARLTRSMKEKLILHNDRLSSLQRSYAFRYPKNLYAQKEQQLDRLYEKFENESYRTIKNKQDLYKTIMLRLSHQHPEEKRVQAREQLIQLEKAFQKEIKGILKEHNQVFASTLSKLNALSPLKIMERGFSIVYDEENTLLKTVKAVEPGDSLQVRLQDGQLDCQVIRVEERQINE